MSKKIFIGAVVIKVIISIFLFNSLVLAKDLKIGYVNFMKVMNSYDKTDKYMKALESKREIKEKQLLAKKEKIDKMNEGLSLLNKTEQEKKKKEITEAIKELKNLEWEAYGDLKKDRDDKMKEIGDDINNIIQSFATKGGYDLIFSEAALIYWNNSYDVTDEILKLVNQKSAGK